MSAEKDAAVDLLPHCLNFLLKPFAVTFGICRTRRTKRALLTKRQIVADCRETRARQGIRQGDQQRSVGIASGAVGQNESILPRLCRTMQKSYCAGWLQSSLLVVVDFNL